MNKTDMSVCAVIVTYNRREYLKNLLEALLKQDSALTGILIFDNCSSDGTDDFLLAEKYTDDCQKGVLHIKEMKSIRIHYFRNGENSGGAGGFHKALSIVKKLNYSYCWIMDDDVLPVENCLTRLLQYQDDACMVTVPNRTGNGYQDYAISCVDMKSMAFKSPESWKTRILPEMIGGDYIEVMDMAFEGPLINSKLIDRIGLPEKELFILFDDSEYALRASKVTKIRFIKDAQLIKQIIPSANGNIVKWKIYYNFRNAVWFNRKYGETIGAKNIRPFLLCRYWQFKYLIKHQADLYNLIKRGYKDGVRGRLGKVIDPKDYR